MPNVQALPEIPLAVATERKQVLDRTMRHLPDAVLDAMCRGLDRHDGRLRPGKLFSGEGGCAVGVMLRELFPSYRANRGLIGRLRRRSESIVDEQPQLARSLPRLAHIEIWFDVTIRICQDGDPRHTVAEWAQAVGRWLAGCLYVELEHRSRPAAEPAWMELAGLEPAAFPLI
jgi:hypothetical protein